MIVSEPIDALECRQDPHQQLAHRCTLVLWFCRNPECTKSLIYYWKFFSGKCLHFLIIVLTPIREIGLNVHQRYISFKTKKIVSFCLPLQVVDAMSVEWSLISWSHDHRVDCRSPKLVWKYTLNPLIILCSFGSIWGQFLFTRWSWVQVMRLHSTDTASVTCVGRHNETIFNALDAIWRRRSLVPIAPKGHQQLTRKGETIFTIKASNCCYV